jgi:hypothetical protein
MWQLLSILGGAALSALLIGFGTLTTLSSIPVCLYTGLACFAHAGTAYLCLREKYEE